MKLGLLSLYLSTGFLAFIVLGAVFTPFTFRASAATESSILASILPENPAPNENTTITLSSYANNLDNVLISWSVNGQKSFSGIGKKFFSVNAPAAGSEMSVVAIISLPEGATDIETIIRPAVTVLLWQANDSYVPPFYKGKAMPTPESEVKVVAMPEIKSGSQAVDPKNMVYAWKKDYSNDQEASGYGKNYFVFLNDYLDSSNNISVTASTVDQKYSSGADIEVGTTQPKVLFYRHDTDLGTIWEQALGNGHKILGDTIIEAAPYFVSPKNLRVPFLTWNWFINDNPVSISGFRKNLMPVTVEAGVSGTSKIKLEIANSVKIFGKASKEISVEF